MACIFSSGFFVLIKFLYFVHVIIDIVYVHNQYELLDKDKGMCVVKN